MPDKITGDKIRRNKFAKTIDGAGVRDGMQRYSRDIDISRSIMTIEYLKVNILRETAELFEEMADFAGGGRREEISDRLADIIMNAYILGRRVGIGYNAIDSKISQKIRLGLIEDSETERHYGDLSELNRVFSR